MIPACSQHELAMLCAAMTLGGYLFEFQLDIEASTDAVVSLLWWHCSQEDSDQTHELTVALGSERLLDGVCDASSRTNRVYRPHV
jgi:hypothetical protein